MIEETLQPLVSVRFATEPKYREGHIRIINALHGRRIMGLHVPDMKKEVMRWLGIGHDSVS